MYSFRALLSAGNLRTPLVVSLSIYGSHYWLQHNGRQSQNLRPNIHWRAPLSLREALAAPKTPPEKTKTTDAGKQLSTKELCRKAFPSVVSVSQGVQSSNKASNSLNILSTASGFVVNNEGYVVTSARAVGNAKWVGVEATAELLENVKVQNPDDWLIYRVAYVEPELDLALLSHFSSSTATKTAWKSKSKPFWLQFAPKDAVKYTEPVVALGYTGQYSTATNGIISCPERWGEDIVKIGKKYGFISRGLPYIQHTASFAYDDFGGPLVDMKGRVVGMCNYLQLIDNVVIYFAVPGDKIEEFVVRGMAYHTLKKGKSAEIPPEYLTAKKPPKSQKQKGK